MVVEFQDTVPTAVAVLASGRPDDAAKPAEIGRKHERDRWGEGGDDRRRRGVASRLHKHGLHMLLEVAAGAAVAALINSFQLFFVAEGVLCTTVLMDVVEHSVIQLRVLFVVVFV